MKKDRILKYLTTRNIWFFTGALIFLYLSFRAFYVPYTHDEIATYFHFIQKQEYLPGEAQWDANNHLLNSYLSIFLYRIFGADVFYLRLPNVLSFIFYFFAAWKLSARMTSPLLRNLLLVSLFFSHGYIEFFALNRGYGLSMAFLLAQILVFLKWNEKSSSSHRHNLWQKSDLSSNRKTVYLFYYSILGFLAVSANLTLLPVIYIFDFLLIASLFYNKISTNILQWVIIIFLVLLLKIPLAWFGFELSSRGALYYGGNDFYNLTVQCLEQMMWGFYDWWTDALVLAIFASSLFLFFKQSFFKKIHFTALSVSLLFFLSIIAIFAQHYILGINFPEDRTGMYIWPLLILSFFFLLDKAGTGYLKYCAFIFVLLPVQFICAFNFSGVTIWKNQGMPQRFYQYIRNDYKGDRPFLGASQKLLGFAWTFHDHKTDPIMGPVQHTGYTDGIAEYVIAIPKHFKDIDFSLYNKIDEDVWSGTILLKRKEPVDIKLIVDSVHKEDICVYGKEFYELIRIKTDSLKGRNVAIEVEGEITSFDNMLYALIVWAGSTKEMRNYYYEQYHLDWYRRCIHRFRVCCILKDIPKDMDEVSVYVFNTRGQNYIINKSEVRAYIVEK